MQIYNLIDLSKMGDEPHEEYGWSYWGTDADGQNVMFSKKTEVIAPCTISAEDAVPKTSKKGKPYLLLKKVSVAEKAPETTTEDDEYPPSIKKPIEEPALANQLDRMETLLQEIRDYVMGDS